MPNWLGQIFGATVTINGYTVVLLIMHSAGRPQKPMHYKNYALLTGVTGGAWKYGSTPDLMHYEEDNCNHYIWGGKVVYEGWKLVGN